MRVTTGTKNTPQYMTWYEFKKDLEKRLGYSILNWDWFRVKPKTPLPWNDSNLRSAFLELSRQDHHKNRSRQGRKTVR